MKPRLLPYIFLLVLVIILIFIVGVKYGRKVEKTDKVISLILSITPTSSPTPTPPPSYKTYKSAGCGVQFLYPDSFTVTKDASEEAELQAGKVGQLHVLCSKENSIKQLLTTQKLATEEVKLKNQTIKARTEAKNGQTYLYFQLRNPLNGKLLYFGINKNQFPLFDSTLEYTGK